MSTKEEIRALLGVGEKPRTVAERRRRPKKKAERRVRSPQETSASREPKDERTPDEQLADMMVWLRDKPLEHVMFSYPWDTDPAIQVVRLPEKYRERFPGCEWGPDEWQCEFLNELGQEIRNRGFDGNSPVLPIRFSTVSGHEIGKSVMVAWLIKFILDTRPMSKGSVTAVTDEQLRTKTWAELGFWHAMSLTQHWFEYTSTRGAMTLYHTDKRYSGKWRCDARTSRREKSEAFAGQHAPTATSFYIFDEASGIYDEIFEVREGGLSSGEPMVFDFGNGTKNSGAFYENCVGRRSSLYRTRSIDSRDVAITNKEKIAEDVETYGLDSDFVRVRWRGQFPRAGQMQFMASDQVRDACTKEVDSEETLHRLVLGVDVARFGDDDSVIFPRRGRDCRTYKPKILSGLDTVQLTDRVVAEFQFYAGLGLRPAAICVDGGGIGGGVVDQLRARGYPVVEVQFGSRPSDPQVYRYKIDELWGLCRTDLPGLFLPGMDDELGMRLYEELTQREYGFLAGGQKMTLESKRDMKKRGLRSPDIADALVLTWAAQYATLERLPGSDDDLGPDPDYDPYAHENMGTDRDNF